MTVDWVPSQVSLDLHAKPILDTALGILIGLRRCRSEAAIHELLGARTTPPRTGVRDGLGACASRQRWRRIAPYLQCRSIGRASTNGVSFSLRSALNNRARHRRLVPATQSVEGVQLEADEVGNLHDMPIDEPMQAGNGTGELGAWVCVGGFPAWASSPTSGSTGWAS